MLSKLIGYEFRATRRIFFPAYLALLALSVLNAVSFALTSSLDDLSLPYGLLMMVYVVAIMAVAFLSLAYMIVRFYQNLLGDEGYLMFTLPVRPWQLLWSKAIVSTVWMAASVVLCGISILIVTFGGLIADGEFGNLLQELPILWNGLASELGGGFLVGVSLEAIVCGLVGVIAFCMHIYAALSLGQLFHRFRLGMSFVMYVLCSVVEQMVLTLFGNIVNKLNLFPDLSGAASAASVLLVMILWSAITAAVYFMISNYLLSRKLNLQ